MQIGGPEWQTRSVPDPELKGGGVREYAVVGGGVGYRVPVDVTNPADTRGVQEEHDLFQQR